MEWAARLYPSRWRRRYGTEFGALLEESGAGWVAMADVLRGALAMRMRSGSIWKFMAACGLIGAAVAGLVSWRMPKVYVSTAVLRFNGDDSVARERLGNIKQEVLSRTALSRIITTHGLYKADRAQRPIEDIVQDMRARDIKLSLASDLPGVFKISFFGSSPAQANQVAQVLVSQFMDRNFEAAVAAGRGALGAGPMEVLDPPSLPERPTSPNIATWIAVGILLGLFVGLLAVGVRRWPVVAAAGGVGALVGLGIAFALPKEYVSTAVVRGDSVRDTQSLVSDAALLRLIENPAFDLYPNERGKMTPAELVASMRRGLTIRYPSAGAIPSPHPVASISFTYPDRYKAQAVTRDLIARLMSGGGATVLDPPSDPLRPMTPVVPQWIAFGLLLGVVAGVAIT